MKTLIINGSPRKNGDTVRLLDEMKKHIKGHVEQLDVYFEDIKPCCDCRKCWEKEGCVIQDRMQYVYKKLDEVDNVVMASPLYFSELTGELLNLASRLQTVYVQRHIRNNKEFGFKRKMGALVIVGGGDGSYKPAEARAKTIFNLMNVEYLDNVFSLTTNTNPASGDMDALRKAQIVAEKLNMSCKEDVI